MRKTTVAFLNYPLTSSALSQSPCNRDRVVQAPPRRRFSNFRVSGEKVCSAELFETTLAFRAVCHFSSRKLETGFIPPPKDTLENLVVPTQRIPHSIIRNQIQERRLSSRASSPSGRIRQGSLLLRQERIKTTRTRMYLTRN